MDDNEKEQLDDALIEAKQAVEMTQLAFQILEQLSGTYNNLLNNNLNDTMKFLTVWSLLLTVPSIVTSFFGMNVPLPFTNTVFGWGIALLISFSLVRMDVDCTLAQNQVMLQSITRPNPAAITNACSWSTINPPNNLAKERFSGKDWSADPADRVWFGTNYCL